MGHASRNNTDAAPSQFAGRTTLDLGHFSNKGCRSVYGIAPRSLALVCALCLTFVLAGCTQKPPAAAAPPPAPVTVATPVQREVIEWDTYNGYLEATESVNVSPRVSGLV